jgi:hypothetical protein
VIGIALIRLSSISPAVTGSKPLAGHKVTLRLDHATLHVFCQGLLIKTCPVTLDGKDLARLRASGGRPPVPHPPPPCHPGRCPLTR